MTPAKVKRNFDRLDDLRYARIGSARLSPSADLAVCDLRQNDLSSVSSVTTLWLINLNTGAARRLTEPSNNSTAPAWSPDGGQIAFLSDRCGKKQVFLLPIKVGEARQFTSLKQGVAGPPVWSPDGSSIAFTAPVDAEPRDPSDPYLVTRPVYRFDGVGYLDEAVQNIYVQSTNGGGARQLTDDDHLDRTLRWSPDGSELLYLASHDPDRSDLFSARLRIVNLAGEVQEVLGLDWGFIKNADWMPDGKRIIVIASSGDQPMATKDDLWLVDRAGGQAENRTADLPWGVEVQWFPVFSSGKILASPSTALVNVVQEGKRGIYSLALSGPPNWRQLVTGNRTTTLQDVRGAEMLFLSSTLENPGELYLANQDGANERQLSNFNQDLVDQIAFPQVDELRYESDGAQIQGWLLRPKDAQPPYPTILYIHGGPHGWYGYQYGSDFQMLAGAGFALLFVNPRGSTGYGNDFATALSGNWGVLDHQDLLAGVDYVIEQGLADPDRLGICGLSYGGYLTCYTIGQTKRFKAAVAENPITDLVSRYGTADMGPGVPSASSAANRMRFPKFIAAARRSPTPITARRPPCSFNVKLTIAVPPARLNNTTPI